MVTLNLTHMEPNALLGFTGPSPLAAIATPDAVPGFVNIDPAGATWRNEVCAPHCTSVGSYRPSTSAAQILCPILYTIGEQDLVTPVRFAHDAALRAPYAEVKTYACGHFDGLYGSAVGKGRSRSD